MKVAHINFSDTSGGAAIATTKIHNLLLGEKIDSHLIVNEKMSDFKNVIGPSSTFKLIEVELRKSFSRLMKKKLIGDKDGTFSLNVIRSGILKKINNLGPDITNLHWIGNEMLSIPQIKKIKSPVVWTLHDMWPYAAAEHYSYENKYIVGYEKEDQKKKFDINQWIWKRKIKFFNFPINFIATSRWQEKNLKNSYLFKNHNIELIPLPLDSKNWFPVDKNLAKEILKIDKSKKTILIGSEGSHHFYRKGMDIIQNIFKKKMIDCNKIQVLILGRKNIKLENSQYVKYFGYLNDKFTSLRLIYSASDLLLMPSRLESFGQMALEAGACGTPTVAFENTGIADIIKHKHSGYLAKNFDIDDFAQGADWCLNGKSQEELNKNAEEFTRKNFDAKQIAKKYINFYEKILNKQ